MKALLAIVVLLLLAAAGFVWYTQKAQREVAATPPTALEVHECRDACEQNAIVSHYDDLWLKRCQARCGGAPPPPREPIKRITVAPADHRVDPRFPPPRPSPQSR
jgi:hypothetical protein